MQKTRKRSLEQQKWRCPRNKTLEAVAVNSYKQKPTKCKGSQRIILNMSTELRKEKVNSAEKRS